MDNLQAYYCKLAQILIAQHQLTKLDLLKYASIEQRDKLPFPYPITEEQKNIGVKLGVQKEDIEKNVHIWIILLIFPEFNMNTSFIFYFFYNSAFWQLNLKYYQQTQKTIFCLCCKILQKTA